MKNTTRLIPLLAVLVITGCATPAPKKASLDIKAAPEARAARAFTGPKKRIAVLDFEDKVPRTQERLGVLEILFGKEKEEKESVGKGMSDMLSTALVQSGKFLVVERQNLQDVLKEQQLAASGVVNDQTTVRIGEVVGAQVLIKGAVTEFQEKTSGGMGGLGMGPFAMGLNSSVARVAIDIKLIDATTGVVLDAKNFDREIEENGLAMVTRVRGITFGGGGFQKTPVGKAVRECIKDAVDYILSRSEKMPWSARVALVKEGKIYINMGADSGINSGDEFSVYRQGEEVRDPETGMLLGAEEGRIGMVRVEEVRDKLSIASALQGGDFRVNDIIRIK